MSEDTGWVTEPVDPADAFGALADGTRVDILRALWEAEERTATFSELREAVGVADSGGFNYHLDKLAGNFVRRTDEGYELALAGRHVVGSLLQGAYTMTADLEPVPLDENCPACGSERELRYEDELARFVCLDCALEARFEVPPGVLAGYDRAELPAVVRRYIRTRIRQVNDGFCYVCAGRTEPDLERERVPDIDTDGPLWFVRYECRRCGAELAANLGTVLAENPHVAAFCQDHDVEDGAMLRLLGEGATELRGEDPLELAVTYTAGSEQLRLVIDGSLSVLETERA
jgi:DNA-binding transcriptional ArsR family regulator